MSYELKVVTPQANGVTIVNPADPAGALTTPVYPQAAPVPQQQGSAPGYPMYPMVMQMPTPPVILLTMEPKKDEKKAETSAVFKRI